jgi:hypothetical protein
MVRRRLSWRGHAERVLGAPLPCESKPLRRAGGGLIARVGAPPLIALATAFGLLALVLCAFFVPGFVLRAAADTTVPTALPAPVQPGTGETLPPSPGAAEPASTPVQPAPVEPPPGRALVTLPWGAGVGQVGLVKAAEGLTRGPEALAVAPDGRIAVLDSVNARLVLLADDGAFTANVPVDLSQPRFLAIDNDLLYVLDADVDQKLLCFDWQGAEVLSGRMPAVGDAVTGLFATDGGPCLEVAHNEVFLVKLTDKAKKSAADRMAAVEPSAPATLEAIPGRPLDHDLAKTAKVTFEPKQGVKLKSYKVDKKTLKAVQIQAVTPALPSGKEVEHLVSVDGDGRGGLIVGARLLRKQTDPKDAPSLIIGRLAGPDQVGATPVLGDTLVLCDSSFAYLGQPYVVAPDGRIFQPVGSAAGYGILVYSLPGTPAAAPPVTVPSEEVQP